MTHTFTRATLVTARTDLNNRIIPVEPRRVLKLAGREQV